MLLTLAAACSSNDDSAPRTNAAGTQPGSTTPGTTTSSNQAATGAANPQSTDGDGSGPVAPKVLQHILVTGQSNAVGYNAHDVQSTSQPFSNLMFDPGVMTSADCDGDGCLTYVAPKSFVPLVEGDTYDGAAVETISSGMANQLTTLTNQQQYLVSDHGRSGMTYACIRKGGCDFYTKPYVQAFDDGQRQIAAAKALATAQGLGYAVTAVALIHGESDHYASPFPLLATDGSGRVVSNYAEALVEFQKDYDDSIKAASGQTASVPLLVSQMNNWNDVPYSEIPGRQLEAHIAAPGKVVLIGPGYQLPFTDDCIHYTGLGERRLGEYFAKVAAKIAGGGTWDPVRPTGATLAGTTITVKYLVPTPPLVLDTTQVSDPGANGFELSDGTAITGVAVSGADAVTITLANAPAAGSTLRYAMHAIPQTCPGPTTGPRGNIRDSDETKSLTGNSLENWGIAFEIAVQ